MRGGFGLREIRMPRAATAVDDDDDWDDGEEDGEALYDDADALLEQMRQLRASVTEKLEAVGTKTADADIASATMHSKLQASILDLIGDVAAGRGPEVSSDTLAAAASSSSAAAAFAQAAEAEATAAVEDPSAMLDLVGLQQPPPQQPPSSSQQAPPLPPQQPHAPDKPRAPAGAKASRFKSASQSFESKSLVSDISRLAAKPLLDDSKQLLGAGPPGRRPPGGGGSSLYSSSSMMGKSLPRKM